MNTRAFALAAFFACAAVRAVASPPLVRSPHPEPTFPRIANCYGAAFGWMEYERGREYWAKLDLAMGVGAYDFHYDYDDPRILGGRAAENILRAKAENPGLIALPYVDVIEGPYNPSLPERFWLRDERGERVSTWPGYYRVDTESAEVLDYTLDAARRRIIAEGAFDGVFYDCWSPETVLVGRTASPGDGVIVMTNAGNLPDSGYELVNGALSEDELNRVLDGRMDYESFLARYLAWTERTRKPCVTTIVCRPRTVDDDPWRWAKLTEPERRARREAARCADLGTMRLGLATALMGDGYFAYDMGTMARGDWWWYPEYDVPLGMPRGLASRRRDGAWSREFEGGLVLVNGGGYDLEIEFGGRMRDVSTGRVSLRFTLPAEDGRIYVPSDEPESALPDAVLRLGRESPRSAVIVEAAGGWVLRAPSGVDLFLGPEGLPLRVNYRAEALCMGGGPVVVAAPWEKYQAEGCSVEQKRGIGGAYFEAKGTLRHGADEIAYRARYEPTASGMIIRYRYTALSAQEPAMWRHYLAFPTSAYAGWRCLAGGASVELPAVLGEPELLPGDRRIELSSAGRRVIVESSIGMGLVDHREWGRAEYLLAGYPQKSAFAKGQAWNVEIELRIEDRK